MAKNAKKTEAKTETKATRERAPFKVRALKRLDAVEKMLRRLARHAEKNADAKLLKASTLDLSPLTDWLKAQADDFKPAGSATSSATRAWVAGDECKLVSEYAFLFPTVKPNEVLTVKEVRKMGEGRGSKTFLLFKNGVAGQASQFEKV